MKLKLEDKINVTPDVVTFVFTGDDLPAWQPGQYLKYTLPHEGADARGEIRWFTIASPPYENQINITTRIADKDGSSFKQVLLALPIGSEIEAGKPGGRFLFDTDRPAVLIAGGIGVTPYRAMLLQLDHDSKDFAATLLYANRDDAYPFKDEFDTIAAKGDNLTVTYVTDPRHLELRDIQAAAATYENPLYYLSGPEPMVGRYKEVLMESGIAEADIRADSFPGYED